MVHDRRYVSAIITNRKSHMSFQLIPKSVTLNDVMTVIFCIISPNSVAFGAHCVKVVKDTPKLSATEM